MSHNTWIHRVVRVGVRLLVATPASPNHMTSRAAMTMRIDALLDCLSFETLTALHKRLHKWLMAPAGSVLGMFTLGGKLTKRSAP